MGDHNYEMHSDRKEWAVDQINMDNTHEVLKILIELKVVLLAEPDCRGGIGEESRRRAWRMVHEVGQLLKLEKLRDETTRISDGVAADIGGGGAAGA